ncbi:unnamed protein product [Gongylonema pulchrum]|uniref:BAH domain-containing protein n=1 Tax=Gongylonema pulchrum TaxID=637853 RepID=A0A183D084_9BILA|nr:unnamed protein product [Gongylonema pulchrum]
MLIETCTGSVQWAVHEDGVQFELQTTTRGLDPDKPSYAALGISKDMHMGDDSVVECVIGVDGVGRAYASEVMLTDIESFLEDGHITCRMKWLFDNRLQVQEEDQFKVFALEFGSWHLLFAKGNADKWSFEKEIHSVNDGSLFPWTAVQRISFCRENCTAVSDATIGQVVIDEMKQTDVSRYWRYRFAVIHGLTLSNLFHSSVSLLTHLYLVSGV